MKNLIFSLSLLCSSSAAFSAYEDYFPAYFEYCTGTQWKLQTGEIGGSPGHGFNYIHGLCKDYTSSYPQVIPCSKVDNKLRAEFPHEGVGISLDKNFSNVMWIAVPGRDLMYFGNTERKSISHQDVQDQIKRITDLKVFSDVISKHESLNSVPFGSSEYLSNIALSTLGTDHAVTWARKLHCVRIPIREEALGNVADFLNNSNNQYRSGKGYEWSKVSNNCVHLSINSSHALGINKDIKVDQKFPAKLFNLALPSHGFMMYADKTVLKRPKTKSISKSLEKANFHPVQVGSLLFSYEAYPSGDYFNTEDLTVLTLPRILKPHRLLENPEKFEKKYFTPENTDLKANAEMWLVRYEKMLNSTESKKSNQKLVNYLREQIELSKKILEEE